MQKAIIGFLIFVIVLMFFSGLFFFYEARYMSGRASVKDNTFSPENSYVITIPTKAKADGAQKIRITVYILNGQGLGVLGKPIFIENPDTANLIFDNLQPNTDSLGKAYIDVSSKMSGDLYLDVKVDGTALPQKAHLIFY
jgi:hypothetical protein